LGKAYTYLRLVMRWAFLLACLTQVGGQHFAVSFVGDLPYTVSVNGTLQLDWQFQSGFPAQVHITLSRDSTTLFSIVLPNNGSKGSYLLDTQAISLEPVNHSITIFSAANGTDADGHDTQTVVVTDSEDFTSTPTSAPSSEPSPPPSRKPTHVPTSNTETKSEESALLSGSQIIEVGVAACVTIVVFCCVYQVVTRHNSRKHMAKATEEEKQFYVALRSPSVNGLS